MDGRRATGHRCERVPDGCGGCAKSLKHYSVFFFLRAFYAERQAYRDVVRAVLTRLRAVKALNQHGVGQAVGQSVKTASAVILCAGLQAGPSELRTAADVLRAMAAFDATEWFIKV